MELKKLETTTLLDALRGMSVGETCIAPDGYNHVGVRARCVELKSEGYLFQTSRRSGVQTITRLK